MALTIYHNPKCSKSRKTLELLHEESKKPKIVLYTEESPTSDDIIDIAEMLNLKVEDLIRLKDIPSSQIKRIKSLLQMQPPSYHSTTSQYRSFILRTCLSIYHKMMQKMF